MTKVLNFVLNNIESDAKSILPYNNFRHDFKFTVDSYSSDNDVILLFIIAKSHIITIIQKYKSKLSL